MCGGPKGMGNKDKHGEVQRDARPSHRVHTKRETDGSMREQTYHPPVLANPGNVLTTRVGGGMDSPLAHENEAPFAEWLAEFFIRSFCPPNGRVLDPFCGSGTTIAVAVRHGRFGIGVDIRESQIELSKRRLETVQKVLPLSKGA